MVQIKFKTFGATSAGGAFAPGDIMRCSEALADHLVNEAKCAVYVQPKPQAEQIDTAEADKPAVRRGRKAKE